MKDAYYFPHDSNAKDDPKCVLLIEQLGLEGYGIYWVLIELLREQPDFTYPLKLIPAIARRYNTSTEKVNTVISRFELFQIQDDLLFLSPSLQRRMEAINEKRAKLREAGRKGGLSKAKALPKGGSSNAKPLPKQVKKEERESREEENKSNRTEVDNQKLSVFEPLLSSLIPYFNIDLSEKDKSSWLSTIDRLIRIDGCSEQQILEVVKWARSDRFWSENFLVLPKLRRKDKDGISYFKRFEGGMNSKNKKPNHNSNHSDFN